MTTTVYGISNCDTVKKARQWLQDHGISHEFHDFRKDGLSQELVENWLSRLDWQVLLNKRSTTWRQLDSTTQQGVGAENVAALLHSQPTLIKRPVVDTGKQLFVGFKAADYALTFSQSA